MRSFVLSPKNLDSEKWKHTRHAATCIVITENEVGARLEASNKFLPILGRPQFFPWREDDLVTVTTSNSAGPMGHRHGDIYVHRRDGEFVRFTGENESDLTPVDALTREQRDIGPWLSNPSDSPADRAAGPVTTPPGIMPNLRDSREERVHEVKAVVTGSAAASLGSVVAQGEVKVSDSPTVRRVLQNRQLVAMHTTGLLALLEDFCAERADRANAHRPELWLDDDVSTDQLRALLTELRDQIRTLNGLLLQAGPPDNAILQKVLGGVGTVGMTYLTEAAKSLGKWTGTGVFFSVALGRFLVDVDAMSVASVCEIVAKIGK